MPAAAGVHREPLFDVPAGGTSPADGAPQPQDGGPVSRVLVARHGPQRAEPEFLQLLRAGAESSDFTAFAKHLRVLQPAAIDRELRAMQVGAHCSESSQNEHLQQNWVQGDNPESCFMAATKGLATVATQLWYRQGVWSNIRSVVLTSGVAVVNIALHRCATDDALDCLS